MSRKEFDQEVFQRYQDVLTSFDDLIGDDSSGMSSLFYLLNKRYLHWLDNDPSISVCPNEIRFRKRFYRVLQKIGPGILTCTQVMENRKRLSDSSYTGSNAPINLPDHPVIFAANHGFHDDILATVLTVRRPCYLIWGSLPLLYNTVDGFAISLVGAVCVNRKSASSRKAMLQKALRAIELGMSIIIFPEGGWNKTSERLLLDFWKGVYDLSAAAKAEVVPIVHYVRDMEVLDKKNLIHTVIDDPIPMYDLPREEAITGLRNTMASWLYKMMETYGNSDRKTELSGYTTSDERWHAHLKERMKGVARYDSSIETYADYRPKTIVRPEDAFAAIADIPDIHITVDNARMVFAARQLVRERQSSDFQRLY